MADEILNGSTFNVNEINYSPVRISPQGGKNIKLLNSSRRWLMITTPLMDTYGASDYTDPGTGVGNGRFSMSLFFKGASDETQRFLEKIEQLETKIKADALKNSKAWFGKVYSSPEVLEALWSPILKYSKDPATGEPNKSKAPYMNVKLQKYSDKWNCEVYNEKGNILYPSEENDQASPLDSLPASTEKRVRCVIQCGGLWITNGKFTVTWELKQISVQSQRPPLMGQKKCYVMIEEPSQSIEDPTPTPRASSSSSSFKAPTKANDTTTVEESDEEGDCSSREGKPLLQEEESEEEEED